MSINVLAGNQAPLENAVALTQGVTANGAAQIKEKETRDTRQTITSDLAKGKTNQIDIRVLRNLVQSLAAQGMDFSPDKMVKKTGHKLKDEYDLMLEEGQDQGDDKFEVKNSRDFIAQIKGKNGQEGGGEGQGEGKPTDVKELTREYVDNFSKYLVSGSDELKKKIESLEGKLLQKGVSSKDLNSLKANIRNSIRGEIMAQVKDSFINRLFVGKENSMEFVLVDRSIDDALFFASENNRLGGEDFGNYRAGLEEALRSVVHESKSEVKDFVNEEMTNQFIGLSIKGEVDHKELRALIKLAGKVGFDEEAFLKQWQQKYVDLGLNLINLPNPAAAGGGNFQERRNKPASGLSDVEEKDIFCNQLRAIYMQRALKGDFLTALQTSFRMRKLKNGMIKLGLTVGDFKQIEKEGREVAILRLKEMLEEVLAERATLYELAGPAMRLIETRQRTILSNLERLGAPVDQADLEQQIENIDVKMHDLAVEELAAVQGLLKAGSKPSLERKQEQLVKLIKRLRAEANIQAPEINLSSVSDRA